MTNCNFENNNGTYGGAIHSNSVGNDVTHCNFTANRASEGGAIQLGGDNNDFDIEHCIFEDNHAYATQNDWGYSGGNGGAINAANHNEVNHNILNVTFINNTADVAGGAVRHHSNWTFNNCSFINNSANPNANTSLSDNIDNGGGALWCCDGLSTLVNTNFTNNNATFGGAIRGAVNARGCLIENNTAFSGNGGGVDIVTCSGGYAIGYTATGEWLEYTVNVKEAGLYSYDAYVSSGATTSSISLSLSNDEGTKDISEVIPVPCVQANNWDNYRAVHGRLLIPLEEGQQIIRINITGGSCNVDKIIFKKIDVDNNINISVTSDPKTATINENTTLSVSASSPTSTIANVKIYLDNVVLKSLTAEPFETTYRPTAKGTYNITAIATDAEGKQSKIAKYVLKVNNKRTAHKGVVNLPGIIEAENNNSIKEVSKVENTQGVLEETVSPKFRVVDNKSPFYGQISNNRFVEFEPLKTTVQHSVTFNITDVLSNVGYDIYLVTAPALANDSNATAIQSLPTILNVYLGYHNKEGVKQEKELARQIETKGDVVNYMLLAEDFKFPVASYGLNEDEPQVTLRLETNVRPRAVNVTHTRTMRIDCIILKPHEGETK